MIIKYLEINLVEPALPARQGFINLAVIGFRECEAKNYATSTMLTG